MQYWLVKSEPYKWSWDDHVKKGIEHWDGVRNYQANNNNSVHAIYILSYTIPNVWICPNLGA